MKTSRLRTIVMLNLAGAGSGMLIAMLAFPLSNELGDFMRPELIALGGTLGLCVTGAYSVWRWGCEP